MLDDNRHRRLGPEGDAPGDHLVQDYPQGVDVGAGVHLLALALFRAHVGRGTQPNPGGGDVLLAAHHLGQAKVA